jgi:YYY domain-containing protein
MENSNLDNATPQETPEEPRPEAETSPQPAAETAPQTPAESGTTPVTPAPAENPQPAAETGSSTPAETGERPDATAPAEPLQPAAETGPQTPAESGGAPVTAAAETPQPMEEITPQAPATPPVKKGPGVERVTAKSKPPTDYGLLLRKLGRGLLAHAPEIVLSILVGIGVYFRFAGNNWSEGTNLNPDELGFNNFVAGIRMPHTLNEYLNTRISTVSPYLKYDAEGNQIGQGPDTGWVWGQWPAIIVRAAAEELTGMEKASCGKPDSAACQPPQFVDYTDYGRIRLLGRFLSALADTITLLFCFLIGLRLYNLRVALLATALSALAVTQIQQSHFMTIDNFGVMFAAAAMYCAVGALKKGGFRWYALFGVFYGMTLASRLNFAPLGAMILVAVIIGQWQRLRDESLEPAPRYLIPIGMFALAVAATLVTFRFTQPMSFRAPTGETGMFTFHLNPDWLSRMKYAEQVSAGTGYVDGYPPAEHWANRPAIITPFLSIVLWGMGLPLGLAAFGGLIWAGVRAFKGVEWKKHLLPVLFAGSMFLFLGTRWVKEMRYFLVIYPFLCLLAAWALVEIWNWAVRERGSWRKALAGVVVGTVLLGTLAWAWKFSEIYRAENTRLEASRWIYQNFPASFRLTMQLDSGGEFQQGVNFYPQPIGADTIRNGFTAAETGTVESLSIGHILDTSGAAESVLHVELISEPPGPAPLATVDITIIPSGTDPRGPGIDSPFGPVVLEKGRRYYFVVSAAQGGPFDVQGAWFTYEAWDEGIPFNLDGFDPNMMFDTQDAALMNIEWPDVEEKRQMLIDNLSRADYVIVQSQRRIWSVCRMPAVYPMTMEYYRALFDGRLGFELVAVFQHPFTFGPLQISDLAGTVTWGSDPTLPVFNLNPLAAEESFSVYDHAPVWIFQKRADFSTTNVENILGAVDLSHTVKQDASQSFGVLHGLMLPQDRLAEQQAGGSWSEMFSYDWAWNKYPGLAAVIWWLWAVLTGWAAMPLVSLAFGGLPDKGYSLAKIAGWLLTAWAAWMLGSFQVPFVWTTIAAVWVVMFAAGGILAWRRRDEWKKWIGELGKTWLVMEAVFAVFFLFDLFLRVEYGDLWHLYTGGEKPMDFSYLNAVIKSTSFPPIDPWFSGGYLNYYYFGFVLVAIPIKLLGTVPSIGFNLALPLLFGTLGLTTYGVVWNLAEGLRRKGTLRISPVLAGIAAAVMLAVLGNLGEVRLVWQGLINTSNLTLPHGLLFGLGDVIHAAAGAFRILTGQTIFPGGYDQWYWAASRAIQFPPGPNGEYVTDWSITEFPFFTFLYADLHAHLIAMPLIVLALAGSAAMVMAPERLRRWQTALPLVAWMALAIGSLWPTNTWNFPVSLATAIVGLLFAGWLMLSREGRLRDWRGWAWILLLGGALAGFSIWLFQPYYTWYGGQTSFTIWEGPKTPLDSYFVIHGLFFFIIITYLLSQTRVWLSQLPFPSREFLDRWGTIVLAVGALLVAAVVILIAAGYPVLAFAVPLIFWSIVLGLRKGVEDEHRLILGLIAISLAITCLVEIVVLKFDSGRQNTVFKFYLQAWIYFSVAAGFALGWLAARVGQWRLWLRRGWTAALGLLVLAALSYTVLGSYYRIVDRMSEESPRSLDGIAFMPYVTYQFTDELSSGLYDLKETYDAIRWMQENIQGSPVIVQSPWPPYRGGLPYTMFTGLPNVLGWNYHQKQQRGSVDDAWINQRDLEIEQFYRTEDYDEARAFLREYNVRYIVLSQLERAYYAGPGLDKFDAMVASGELKVVFSENKTVIYEVVT